MVGGLGRDCVPHLSIRYGRLGDLPLKNMSYVVPCTMVKKWTRLKGWPSSGDSIE